jgi:diguanylate cyclase (GGDEF)-like protein/PAS domain S-box-containing protein
VDRTDLLHAIDAADLNDNLPVAVLVVDDAGIIRHFNVRATELTGYDADEAIGRSIVDFVDHHDLDFLMASFTAAPEFTGEVMGPARLRYRGRDGSVKWTDYWAYHCPESFGFDGYIITLSMESVTDNLANAAFQIASGDPLETTLASIAHAVRGQPLAARGSLLVRGDAGPDVIGPWPFGERDHVDDPALPWHDTLITGESCDVDVASLPRFVRAAAERAGFRSLSVRGVMTQGATVAGAFVAWRPEPGPPSPNQDRHLAEVVGVARLAFDNDEHRRELERAALFDHLTGVGNRALLARHLADAIDDRVAVLYIDLDSFKQVNDTHGHDIGDLVLAATAQRLRSVVRDADAVFRIGGDEFVVLCHGIGDDQLEGMPHEIANRIIRTLGSPFQVASVTVTIGASIGVAHRRADDTTADVIRRADQALLFAKREGKSQWRDADDLG